MLSRLLLNRIPCRTVTWGILRQSLSTENTNVEVKTDVSVAQGNPGAGKNLAKLDSKPLRSAEFEWKSDYVKVDKDLERLKKSVSFDEMPGPVVLKVVARFWNSLPVFGTAITTGTLQYMLSVTKIFGTYMTWGRTLRLFSKMFDTYGPVIRLHGPLGGNVVLLSRPEHAQAVFMNEGRFPVRSIFDSIEKYRSHRKYMKSGPFSISGPEWEAMRTKLDVPLQKSVGEQFDKLCCISDEFLARIKTIRNRHSEVPELFDKEISKWGLQSLCSVLLNKRIGFLDPRGISTGSEPGLFLDAFYGATDAILKCESGLQLWKFMETRAWKLLVRHCDQIDGILLKQVKSAEKALQEKSKGDIESNSGQLSLLDKLLLEEKMDMKDILTIFMDMILIGVNATSHSLVFLLYHLAKHPRTQRLLHDEINKSWPEDQHLEVKRLSGMSYLQACIKESLRLKPPMPVLARELTDDTVVHSYFVPRGTSVLMATHLASLREDNFEDALRFKPERWIGPEAGQDVHALASMPFGHGPRACLARHLAETQLGIVITKIIRKYKVEYHYGDVSAMSRMLSPKDRPLKFRFADRTS